MGKKTLSFSDFLKNFFTGQLIIIGVKTGNLGGIRKELLGGQAGIWESGKNRQFFNFASSLPVLN